MADSVSRALAVAELTMALKATTMVVISIAVLPALICYCLSVFLIFLFVPTMICSYHDKANAPC